MRTRVHVLRVLLPLCRQMFEQAAAGFGQSSRACKMPCTAASGGAYYQHATEQAWRLPESCMCVQLRPPDKHSGHAPLEHTRSAPPGPYINTASKPHDCNSCFPPITTLRAPHSSVRRLPGFGLPPLPPAQSQRPCALPRQTCPPKQHL